MKMLIVKVKVKTPAKGHEENHIEMIETLNQAEETIDDEAEAEMMMGEEITHTIAIQEGEIQEEKVAETEQEIKAQAPVTVAPLKITPNKEEIVTKITENALMKPQTKISPRVLRGKKKRKRIEEKQNLLRS
jgi:hypothetical protein